MAKKRGLGRGLASLLNDAPNLETKTNEIEVVEEIDVEKEAAKKPRRTRKTEAKPKAQVKEAPVEVSRKTKEDQGVEEEILRSMQTLAIDLVQTNPDQPRKEFDEDALDELAQSIGRYGILQPIVVKRTNREGSAPYEIVAGERRYRAAQKAGLSEIPVVLREGNNEETAIISVVENVQREDLNPLEEALAYQNIMQSQMITQQELANALGKSRPYIANIVRLTKLDDETMDALRKGLLTSSQARSLLSEPDLKKRAKYRQLLIEGKTSVNTVEGSRRRIQNKDIYIVDMENRLSESLGTKVSIQKKRKGWNVQVACYSEEDLQRFLERVDND